MRPVAVTNSSFLQAGLACLCFQLFRVAGKLQHILREQGRRQFRLPYPG